MKTDTTQNTAKMEREVLKAAHAKFGRRKTLKFRTAFEHGQWWLFVDDLTQDVSEGESSYSVVDTNNGFDFEEI